MQVINEYARLKRKRQPEPEVEEHSENKEHKKVCENKEKPAEEFQYVFIHWINDEPRILYSHAKDNDEIEGPEISCPMSFVEEIIRIPSKMT
jgi:hypothetical protein